MDYLLERPPVGPTTIKLRPYQNEAIDAVNDRLKSDRSTLLILPTGTGKTVTFGMLARQWATDGKRSLIIAHRGELITQAVEKLSHLGLTCEQERADRDAFVSQDCHAVIATVQTLQRKRLTRWPKDHFDLIITDEAHHATAGSYCKIYNHFSEAKHLGVTATADRSDKVNLGEIFDSVAYEMLLWDAIHYVNPDTERLEPCLSQIKFVQCEVGVDLASIRTTGGDYNQGDLEDAIRPYIEVFANAVKKVITDRKTILFTPCVGSAQAMATAMESIGIKSTWISGDDKDRDAKLELYRLGEVQVICNCALLTEGFDSPHTSAVVLMRPTKSRSLYSQMVGRGTRLHPGKNDCLIVDFSWLTRKHDLVKLTDLIKPPKEMDKRVEEIVNELVAEHEEIDLADAIAKAEVQKEQEDEQKRLKVLVQERNLAFRMTVTVPVTCEEWLGVTKYNPPKTYVRTATEKQRETLVKMGIEAPAGISVQHASELLNAAITRRTKGLATYKQMKTIHKWAPHLSRDEIRGLSIKDAGVIISELAERHGWGNR